MMMIQFEFVLLLVDVRVDDLLDDNAGLIVFLFDDGIDDLSC